MNCELRGDTCTWPRKYPNKGQFTCNDTIQARSDNNTTEKYCHASSFRVFVVECKQVHLIQRPTSSSGRVVLPGHARIVSLNVNQP
jgi:hypothetical protein